LRVALERLSVSERKESPASAKGSGYWGVTDTVKAFCPTLAAEPVSINGSADTAKGRRMSVTSATRTRIALV
jgi:hypothetical protein